MFELLFLLHLLFKLKAVQSFSLLYETIVWTICHLIVVLI
jgi:hypothetical protein